MYKIIFFVIFFVNVSWAQENNLYTQLIECKLQNIHSCDVGYLDVNNEKISVMEKFFPSRDFIKNIFKNKIPKLRITEEKPDCVIFIQYDVTDVQTDNSEFTSFGNVELRVSRRANIEGQDCELYLLLDVASYAERVLFINPQNSYEDFKKFFENIVTNLINEFAIDYYKTN